MNNLYTQSHSLYEFGKPLPRKYNLAKANIAWPVQNMIVPLACLRILLLKILIILFTKL